MWRRAAVAVLVAVALGWSAGIVAAPLVRVATEGQVASHLAAMTYAIGALVCHQRPERSFHLAGAQLPVCARCAALYWAGALGLVGWLFVRRRTRRRGGNVRAGFTRSLVVSGVPLGLSVVLAAATIWDPPNLSRALISAPFGVVLGAMLSAVTLEDLR